MRNSTLYRNIPYTFRRSSTKILPEKNKKNVGWGSNLQNQDKGVRKIYVSDGFTGTKQQVQACRLWLETGETFLFTDWDLANLRPMIQTDQDGAEARIVAYDSADGLYRQLFRNKIKVHSYVAAHLFKDEWASLMAERSSSVRLDMDEICSCPIDQLKQNLGWRELAILIKESDNWAPHLRYYYFAKQTCHSGNYDVQAEAFRMNVLDKSRGQIVIPSDQATYFLQSYRALFPEIPERNRRIKRQVDETGIIYNLFGFPFQITTWNITEQFYKKCYAWAAQSTVGEITRIAFTEMQSYIEANEKNWDNLADTHDSYMHSCPILDVPECCRKSQEFICRELTSLIDGTKFRMGSETQVGFNWGPYKKGENELGLRELRWMKL